MVFRRRRGYGGTKWGRETFFKKVSSPQNNFATAFYRSNAGSVEGGYEFSGGGAFVLHEAIFYVGGKEGIFHHSVFFIGYFAVDFRVVAVGYFAAGYILPHQAEHHLSGAESLGNKLNDFECIFYGIGQYQVADYHALLHNAIVINYIITGLAVHLFDGSQGGFGVIADLTVTLAQCVVGIFIIGQIDLHFVFKEL